MKKNNSSHTTWLRILVITLLVIGVFFRLVNLDKKIFWGDETVTLMRVSGYTWAEMDPQLYNGNELSIADFQKYQRINPDKNVIDIVTGLAAEEPQHPPLYYLLARLWVQWFGNSVAVLRSVSALLSLLVFPSLWWLCRELFDSWLPGWIAIAIIAVSPFHLLYAQEAREYSFWTATILLSSAALLRALRLKSKLSWIIYAATVVLGLYTYLFSLFVVIAHATYVIAIERRWSKTVKAYIISTIGGILVFAPWLYIIVTNISQINKTTSWSQETGWVIGGVGAKLSLLAKWARNLTLVFLDADKERRIVHFGFDNIFLYLIQLFFILFIVTLTIYSIYFLYRHAPKRAWLFILTLVGIPALALMLPDLIFGGVRSVISRYMIPFYLGIQLAVAYTIAGKISFFTNRQQRQLWQFIMVTLLSLGIISCTVNSNSQMWWSKSYHDYDPQMAQIINQADRPLLVCIGQLASANAMPITYLLEPKVRLQLVLEPNLPKMSDDFSNVFLYRPVEQFLINFKNQHKYRLEPVYEYSKNWLGKTENGVLLWELKKL